MGYYDDGKFRSTRKRGRATAAGRWVAVVVLSAAIGSAMTFAIAPNLIRQEIIPASNIIGPGLDDTSYTRGTGKTEVVNVEVNDGIEQAVKKVLPSVVGVLNYQYLPSYGGQSLQEYGVGSGVIFSKDGYIVTNNHVVQGAAKVDVVLDDKTYVDAKVIGTDPYTDIAVLKIPARYIKPKDVAVFGNSRDLVPGEPAIAIGNPAGLHFADTVTVGVISATQRIMPVEDEATGQSLGYEEVLQTDAAINPGNSGGPLCNILGQVIGINSSKIVAHGFEGMGFSIPINEVRRIVRQILLYGHALHPEIGIAVESLSDVPQNELPPGLPVKQGVYVVSADTAYAKAAGFRPGDVIVAIGARKVDGFWDLENDLNTYYRPGDHVSITVYRGSKREVLHEVLGEMPQHPSQLDQTQGSSGSDSVP
jgi:serine protease Do